MFLAKPNNKAKENPCYLQAGELHLLLSSSFLPRDSTVKSSIQSSVSEVSFSSTHNSLWLSCQV